MPCCNSEEHRVENNQEWFLQPQQQPEAAATQRNDGIWQTKRKVTDERKLDQERKWQRVEKKGQQNVFQVIVT